MKIKFNPIVDFEFTEKELSSVATEATEKVSKSIQKIESEVNLNQDALLRFPSDGYISCLHQEDSDFSKLKSLCDRELPQETIHLIEKRKKTSGTIGNLNLSKKTTNNAVNAHNKKY